MEGILELRALEGLNDPVVVAGFTVDRRAGRLPVRTLLYLNEQWGSELVAKTDIEGIYNLVFARPEARYQEDQRVVEWPQVHIHLARPPGASRDILLLIAREPNFRWQSTAETLTRYLQSKGVRTLIVLRAFPGHVPHTRPAPVVFNGLDRELAAKFGAHPSGEKYEGETDFGGVLGAEADSLGWQVLDLSVLQPLYFPRMPNMQGMAALIKALDSGLGTATSVEILEDAAYAQARQIDAGIEASEETKRAILELERTYDAGFAFRQLGEGATGDSADLPSAEDVIGEIERLFRGGADDQPSE
jgi:hypothetical protein